MTITVTADDIALGKPCSASGCPVARAVRRATGQSDVVVTYERIRIGDGDTERRVWTPAQAVRFMELFDSERSRPGAAPFAFDIPDPPEAGA